MDGFSKREEDVRRDKQMKSARSWMCVISYLAAEGKDEASELSWST